MIEAESRKKDVTQSTLTTKMVKTLIDHATASSQEVESGSAITMDYGLAARTVQHGMFSKNSSQKKLNNG